MSKVGKWSTTAGNNNATPPDGWPENQLPSTVNNCAREMMAAIATYIRNAEYIDLDNTPSFLTATTFSLGTTDATNFEVGRRLKLFDATTLYGTIISNSATFVQVRLDSGVLTASLSSVAVSVIRNTNSSLPNAAFDQNNVIINGAFDLWQRTASVASVASSQYVADRFKYIANNTAICNMYRDTNVPTLASAGVKLNSSLTVAVSATDAVIAAGDFAAIRYDIEGYDWRRIAHRPLGLSFQVSTNCSGTYAVSIRSTGSSASYVQNLTISAINTWTRFFVPFPEAPTAYTWDYSTGAGLIITWSLAAGATYQATAGEWTAMAALATSSQVNFLATAANTFSLADVRLKPGIADTPIAHRTYAQELAVAQRYYEVGRSTVSYYAAIAGVDERHAMSFKTMKRIAPTMTITAVSQLNVASATTINPTAEKFDHRVVATAAGSTSDDSAVWTADSEL